MVSSSANGTEIQTPTTSKNCGSISKPREIKTNVLKVEIIANTFPLDRAVNAAEANIFKPQHKKLIGNIRKPCLAPYYIINKKTSCNCHDCTAPCGQHCPKTNNDIDNRCNDI